MVTVRTKICRLLILNGKSLIQQLRKPLKSTSPLATQQWGNLIQNMSDKKYKVVILGDSTVGKSSILFRLKFSSFSGKQEVNRHHAQHHP